MPLRKLSISRKGSSGNVRELDANARKDRPPPTTRAAPVASETAEDSPRKRKPSIAAKSRRRLSAIFGGSPSSRSDRGSPAPEVASPSASLTSTPAASVANSKYSTLDSHGTAPQSVAVAELPAAIKELNLNSAATASPPRVLAPNSPIKGDKGTLSPPVTQPIVHGAITPASTIGVPSGASTPTRVASLYSQWGLDDSDSDDEGAFATPSEGLSEVEEEDEDEEPKVNGHVAQASKDLPKAVAATATSSQAPSVHSTGPRIHRSQATGGAKVSRHAFKPGNPLIVDQAASLAPDLETCRQVLTLFLRSRMREAEDMLVQADPDNSHMYLQSGHGIIQSLKGMMTFDKEDLSGALEITSATAHTATALRKSTDSVLSKIGGIVRPGAALSRVRHMSVLERHAELVYAETVLVKAILTIVNSGDFMSLIREAFNMRTAHGIYRTLQQFLEESDKNGFDEDIDMDFRSGVLLGTGTSSLMLSLLPSKVLKIAEVFGYGGDRTVALQTLLSAGGWRADSHEPEYTEANEGIRRPICDMVLLTFHLVISVLMPVSGIDLDAARKILDYNLKRYPNGIFFLYFQARLYTNTCQPERAIESLQAALDLELEYVQLQHIMLWDYGCNYMQLNEWNGARQCFDILRRESNWSRAVYTYAAAANTMEVARDEKVPEATDTAVVEMVESIPKLTKKLAGKSLPIEKLVARKARKFLAQKNYLFLPAMELSYVFGSLYNTPRRILISRWLPRINAELARLEATQPAEWGNGEQYWDDFVLGHFLRAMVQSTARYQPREAAPEAAAKQPGEPSDEELDAGAEADFKLVNEHAIDVRLDHYLLFHNHYELGRLYARRGDATNAMVHFDIVMHNKLPKPNVHQGKGKYSLEGALQIKTHAAISSLKEEQAGKAVSHR